MMCHLYFVHGLRGNSDGNELTIDLCLCNLIREDGDYMGRTQPKMGALLHSPTNNFQEYATTCDSLR